MLPSFMYIPVCIHVLIHQTLFVPICYVPGSMLGPKDTKTNEMSYLPSKRAQPIKEA